MAENEYFDFEDLKEMGPDIVDFTIEDIPGREYKGPRNFKFRSVARAIKREYLQRQENKDPLATEWFVVQSIVSAKDLDKTREQLKKELPDKIEAISQIDDQYFEQIVRFLNDYNGWDWLNDQFKIIQAMREQATATIERIRKGEPVAPKGKKDKATEPSFLETVKE